MFDFTDRWSRFCLGSVHADRGPRNARLMLVLMACALFGVRLGQPLLEPDEARYAEIPRQMLAEGHFVTPTYHGEAYYQKPPLLYWLVMTSYRLFGVNDTSARLVPILASILTILITHWWGKRSLGGWGGFVAGVILCLSARFLYLTDMLNMDGLLTTCTLSSLAFGHRGLIENRPRWLYYSALCLGLGILTKGPVAVVLVLAPLFLTLLLDRRLAWPQGLDLSLCVGIVAITAAPWFLITAWSDPNATGTFFWLHNIVRYLAPFDHEQPAWTYLPSLFLGTLPWSLLLIPALPYLTRRRLARHRPEGLGILLLSFVSCVAFFSLSGCKRPAYILPAFPLMALILACFLTHGLPWRRWVYVHPHRHDRSYRIFEWGLGGTAVLFGVLLLANAFVRPVYQRQYTIRHEMIENREQLPVVSYPKRWDSIGFYLQREVNAFTPAQKTALAKQWAQRTLVFVKRDGQAMQDLQETLPKNWEFVPRSTSGNSRLIAGVVAPRQQAISGDR